MAPLTSLQGIFLQFSLSWLLSLLCFVSSRKSLCLPPVSSKSFWMDKVQKAGKFLRQRL